VDKKTLITSIAVCRNRTENLIEALPTWLEAEGLDEIHIYDFASDRSVHSQLQKKRLLDEKVKVFQCYQNDSFSLSKFLNVALSITESEYILKLDCDYKIDRSFLKAHPIKSCFYTGDWRLAKDSNESNLTGLLYAKKKDIMRVNGYNENIKTWGYEDEDLYERMSRLWGVKRRIIDMDLAYHIPHTDEIRQIEGGIDTYWSTILWDDLGMYNLVRKNIDISKRNPWQKNNITTKGEAAQIVEGLYFFNYV